MSVDPVRFAYVGCGFMGQMVHIPNFAALPECRFMALAEPRTALGKTVAQRYGIAKVYASHHEIAADKDIEAVGVSAPPAVQSKIAEDLLAAGKHVYMEKPMALGVARAQSMLAASKKGGGRLMVAYMKRYDPGNLLIKQQIDAWKSSNEAGKLLFARAHGFCGSWLYGMDQNIPFEKSNDPAPPPSNADFPAWLPADRRGAYEGYLQQWTHNVNLLRFFLGTDRSAEVKIDAVNLDPDGMTGVTIAHINGVRCSIETGGSKSHVWDEQTQVYFEGGWVRGEGATLMHKETPAGVEVYRAPEGDKPAAHTRLFPKNAWPYREEARHFLQNVRSGEAFRSTGEDTINDVKVFEEIYRQFLKLG